MWDWWNVLCCWADNLTVSYVEEFLFSPSPFESRNVCARASVTAACGELNTVQGTSSLIPNPQSNPQTFKSTKSKPLVFGWESGWLSCWWQPLSLLSGFPLLRDKIYEYGEGWWERNPHRLSLVYLDFCSQHSLLPVGWKWVTLARMWITVVTDTVVVNWPMVRVGEWEMGVGGKGEETPNRTSWNLPVN